MLFARVADAPLLCGWKAEMKHRHLHHVQGYYDQGARRVWDWDGDDPRYFLCFYFFFRLYMMPLLGTRSLPCQRGICKICNN